MKTKLQNFNLQTEPAIIIGAIGAVLIAVIESLPIFFPQVSGEQVGSLLLIVQRLMQLGTVIGTLVMIRRNVYSPNTVARDFAELEPGAAASKAQASD